MPSRHGLRPARAERRGQDDRGAGLGDACCGSTAGARRWRGSTSRRRPRRCGFRIGLTSQHDAVEDALTGRQNLEMFGRLFHLSPRVARRRADELLERFGLADAARRPAKQYSGGMRRRLDLAASFVLAPRVLFLDEPTTGQDPRNRNEVWDVVRSFVAEGTTVLLTTHYLDEADQLCDSISVDRPRARDRVGHAGVAEGAARRVADRRRRARSACAWATRRTSSSGSAGRSSRSTRTGGSSPGRPAIRSRRWPRC